MTDESVEICCETHRSIMFRRDNLIIHKLYIIKLFKKRTVTVQNGIVHECKFIFFFYLRNNLTSIKQIYFNQNDYILIYKIKLNNAIIKDTLDYLNQP